MSKDFKIIDGVLVKYIGYSTEVIIPDEIYKIGEGAFRNRRDIKSIVISNNVKIIEDSAFENCIKSRFKFCDGSQLEYIGESAFLNCCHLYVLPELKNLKKMGAFSFVNCRKLKKVILSEKLEEIENCTFVNDKSLKDIVIPSNIKNIRKCAFVCSGISSLNLSKAVDITIAKDAFLNCDLKECLLPKNTEAISTYDFLGENMRKILRGIGRKSTSQIIAN